jgi:DnaJ-domain-containing protein 1
MKSEQESMINESLNELLPNAKVSRWQTPEERELGAKRAELATLQQELAQRELDLTTLEIELRALEVRYLRMVGSRMAILDELEAKIAELKSALDPQNTAAREKAKSARKQAEESAQRAAVPGTELLTTEFKPSEDLKKLYREVAKKIHPDLAEDENERLRREQFMKQANIAFENGDTQRLRQILQEWGSSPESVKGEGIAAELIRIIRKIAQVEERLRVIESQVAALKHSDLFQLKERVEESKRVGADLLGRMAHDLDRRIAAAQIELEAIQGTDKQCAIQKEMA